MVSRKKCIGSFHILGNAIKFQGQIYWMKCKICLASVDYRQDFCVKLLSLPWWGVWVEMFRASGQERFTRVTPFAGSVG